MHVRHLAYKSTLLTPIPSFDWHGVLFEMYCLVCVETVAVLLCCCLKCTSSMEWVLYYCAVYHGRCNDDDDDDDGDVYCCVVYHGRCNDDDDDADDDNDDDVCCCAVYHGRCTRSWHQRVWDRSRKSLTLEHFTCWEQQFTMRNVNCLRTGRKTPLNTRSMTCSCLPSVWCQ